MNNEIMYTFFEDSIDYCLKYNDVLYIENEDYKDTDSIKNKKTIIKNLLIDLIKFLYSKKYHSFIIKEKDKISTIEKIDIKNFLLQIDSFLFYNMNNSSEKICTLLLSSNDLPLTSIECEEYTGILNSILMKKEHDGTALDFIVKENSIEKFFLKDFFLKKRYLLKEI